MTKDLAEDPFDSGPDDRCAAFRADGEGKRWARSDPCLQAAPESECALPGPRACFWAHNSFA